MSEPISAPRLVELGAIVEKLTDVDNLHTYAHYAYHDDNVYTFPLSNSGSNITSPNRLVFERYSEYMNSWSVVVWDVEDDEIVWLGWTVKTEEEFRDLCRILKVKLKETS